MQIFRLPTVGYFVVGTDRSLTLREIAKAVYAEIGRLPKDAREEMEVTKVYDPYFGTTTSATHIAALLDEEKMTRRLRFAGSAEVKTVEEILRDEVEHARGHLAEARA